MKILYIQRRPPGKQNPRPRCLRDWLGIDLKGQDGFFEASLCTAFPNAEFVYLHEVSRKTPSFFDKFDWILVNRKCVPDVEFGEKIVESLLKKIQNSHRALVVNNAEEGILPPAGFVEPFEIIFKREVLKDPAGYGLPDHILQKIRPTMISCPFVDVRRKNKRLRVQHLIPPESAESSKSIDLSFVGADTNENRRILIRKLNQQFEDFKGGLYAHKCKHQPLDWDGPKMAQLGIREYLQMIHHSKINLALPGYGGFTYRHLELWYMGGFMLTSPEIRTVRLPGASQPAEGVHYVSFDSVDDCVQKAEYYLHKDAEREKIALAGRHYFEEVYDFTSHAAEISRALHL